MPAEEFEELTLPDPTLAPEYANGKKAIVDIKLQTKSGRLIYIDIQRRKYPSLWQRFLYYGSKMVVNHGKSGSSYANIKQVICIILTDFREYETEVWRHRLTLNDPVTGAHFPEGMVYYVLELPKITVPDGTLLGDWMVFFNSKTEEQLMSIASSSPAIKESVGIVKKMSGSDRDRAIALSLEMARMDLEAVHYDGLQEGREEGREEGMEIGMEIGMEKVARSMLADGFSLEVIQKHTGLEKESILALS